jgi:hypothetical protein
MSKKIDIVVVSYYYSEPKIYKMLNKFRSEGYKISIQKINISSIDLDNDCMDMSQYAKIFSSNSDNILVLNDTLFKKIFWRTTLRSLLNVSEQYKNISGIPFMAGDLHRSGDLNMAYHYFGRHVSTYAFYCNKEAKDTFLNIYLTYSRQTLEELCQNTFHELVWLRNFCEVNSRYTWAGKDTASVDLRLRKFRAIIIELELSKLIFERGVIMDIKNTYKIRILHKLRGILNAN